MRPFLAAALIAGAIAACATTAYGGYRFAHDASSCPQTIAVGGPGGSMLAAGKNIINIPPDTKAVVIYVGEAAGAGDTKGRINPTPWTSAPQ